MNMIIKHVTIYDLLWFDIISNQIEKMELVEFFLSIAIARIVNF